MIATGQTNFYKEVHVTMKFYFFSQPFDVFKYKNQKNFLISLISMADLETIWAHMLIL